MDDTPQMAAISPQDAFARLELLVGVDGISRLHNAHVLVVGLGGVGSWAAEALARSAVGTLTLLDFDCVAVSNLNRQLPALQSTIGMAKVDVLAARFHDIAPNIVIHALKRHLTPDAIPELLAGKPYDVVIDAIDERAPKLALLTYCAANKIPVISSMGAANKRHTADIAVADISKTYGCRLAKSIRKGLAANGVKHGVTVVFSPELTVVEQKDRLPEPGERRALGTVAFVPASFGLKCAEAAIDVILA